MVGLGRLELPTSRLSGVRSNHLSYRPEPARAAPENGNTLTDARASPVGNARADDLERETKTAVRSPYFTGHLRETGPAICSK